MSQNPTCTVLVAAYNAEKYIRQCLDSLLAQTLESIEIIVVDDHSADHTPEIVAQYAARDGRIVAIRLDENSGQAHARNIGLRQARGRYVCFLDSDDWFAADALELAVAEFEKHALADCVLFDVVIYDGPGRQHPIHSQSFDVKDGHTAFADSLTWAIHGVYMTRTELHQRYPYDETTRAYSDDNTTRIHYYVAREVRSCRGRYFYRQHPESTTHRVSERHFDYLKANESMKRQLLRLKVEPSLITLYENMRWLVVVDCYWFYFRHRKQMSKPLKRYALAEIRRVWATIETDRLYRRNRYKPGFCPLRPFWQLFRLQEELYFVIKKALNR